MRHADGGQRLLGGCGGSRARDTGEAKRIDDLLKGGQCGEEIEALEDEAAMLEPEAVDHTLIERPEIGAEHLDAPRTRPEQAGGSGEQRGLARARWAHDQRQLARAHLECDALQCAHRDVALGELALDRLQADGRFGGHRSSSAGSVFSRGPSDSIPEPSATSSVKAAVPTAAHQGTATATTTLAAAEEILAGSGAMLAAGRGGKLRLADPLATDTPQFDLPSACVLACEPLPLPASLRPLPRAIAVRWGRNHAPLSNMAGSVAAVDRQRLSQEGSFARAESSLITSRVAQQREMTFPATYWTEAEALVRAEKWRAVLEAGPRMLRVLTDRYLGQVEIGQIGRVTYPAFGFQNGFIGVVVGWRERLSARRVEITLWGAG